MIELTRRAVLGLGAAIGLAPVLAPRPPKNRPKYYPNLNRYPNATEYPRSM
jgi:hypothetical protein